MSGDIKASHGHLRVRFPHLPLGRLLEVADVSTAVTGGSLPVALFLPFAGKELLHGERRRA